MGPWHIQPSVVSTKIRLKNMELRPYPGLVHLSSLRRLRSARLETFSKQQAPRRVVAPRLFPASHSFLVLCVTAQEGVLASSGAHFPGS